MLSGRRLTLEVVVEELRAAQKLATPLERPLHRVSSGDSIEDGRYTITVHVDPPTFARHLAGSLVPGASQYLVQLPLVVGSVVVEALVILVLSLYWLIESPRLWRFVRSLLPGDSEERTARLSAHLSSAIGGYVRGAAIDGAIVGTIAAVALALAGIDFAIALGVVTAIGELVPYLGPLLAGGLAATVGLLQSPWHGLLAVILYVGIQQLEGHVLTPMIMRSQTTVSATVVIIALLVGSSVGGVLGALTAVPLAAAIRTIVVEVVVPALRHASPRSRIQRAPPGAA